MEQRIRLAASAVAPVVNLTLDGESNAGRTECGSVRRRKAEQR
jgi:hypothetical protein